MKARDGFSDRTRPSTGRRKPYRTPELTDHGSVVSLTRGGSGSFEDASGPIFSGAGGLFSPVEGDFGE